MGEPGWPFQQPPQVFANLGDHFQLMKVSDPSHYFAIDHRILIVQGQATVFPL